MLLDPLDDITVTSILLARHAPAAGVIIVRTTPGRPPSPRWRGPAGRCRPPGRPFRRSTDRWARAALSGRHRMVRRSLRRALGGAAGAPVVRASARAATRLVAHPRHEHDPGVAHRRLAHRRLPRPARARRHGAPDHPPTRRRHRPPRHRGAGNTDLGGVRRSSAAPSAQRRSRPLPLRGTRATVPCRVQSGRRTLRPRPRRRVPMARRLRRPRTRPPCISPHRSQGTLWCSRHACR